MSTEREAKFIVPESETFAALRAETALAGFLLQPGRLVTVHDTYLDTPDRALLAAGYACRRREQEGGIIMTLKGIAPAERSPPGAIHRREELEVRLSADSPPALWPAGAARDAALAIVQGEPLEVLFHLRQERFISAAFDGERRVAMVSLDLVEVAGGHGPERYRELELELAPDGTEADLALLASWVMDRYRLHPSAGSKFERAMAHLGAAGGPARRGTRPAVSREETVTLEAPVELSSEVLLEGLSAMGYRPRPRATRCLTEVFFDSYDGGLLRKGHVLGHSLEEGRWRLRKGEIVEAEQAYDGETPPVEGEIPSEISQLTRSRVSLPFLQGSMQETEYWLKGVSRRAVRLFLRRWVFHSPLQEVSPRDILFVSARGSPQATGLPYLLTLLRERFGCRAPEGTILEQGLARLGLPAPGAPLPERFLIAAQDSPAGACRKVLGGEAWRMRACAVGALRDLDIEYVHLLRVATRRARFAVRLFRAFFPGDAAPALRAELAWIAGLLGTVRDLDVMLAGLVTQVSFLEAPADFEQTIRGHLLARRVPAREALAAALGSERFTRLLALLESPLPAANDSEGAMSISRFAEGKVGKAMARLGHWTGRPTQSLGDAELHRLRILFKRLRYTCEFFRPLFSQELGELIAACVRYQDCLGALQDAAVASAMLQAISADMPCEAPTGHLMSLGALLQLQRDIRRAKRERFLDLWEGWTARRAMGEK